MTSTGLISTVLHLFTWYAMTGGLVALSFLLLGMERIDHATRQTGLVFKLLILPGLVVLWPLVILRWLSGGQPHGD